MRILHHITHPTHGAGARPGQAQAPTATRLATPNDDQCVHQPREGRGRNRQPPPRKKKGNKQTAQTRKRKRKKKGGGKRKTHSREAAPPLHKRRANPPASNTEGDTPQAPPKEHARTALPNRSTPDREQRPTGGKDTPDTQTHTPLDKWRGEKKTLAQLKQQGKGGQRPRDPRLEHTERDTTKPRHDGAENHTAPPQPEKKKRGGGGRKPHPQQPQHTPTPQAARPEDGGKRTRRTQEAMRHNTQARKKRSAGKTQTNTHTHHEPQPGKAERDQILCPDKHILDPSQECRDYP